jgi:hypothetical protein
MNDTILTAREYAEKAACAAKMEAERNYRMQQDCNATVGSIGSGYVGAVKGTSSRFTAMSALETLATDHELKAKRLRALYAALPREMSEDAEAALAELITKALK